MLEYFFDHFAQSLLITNGSDRLTTNGHFGVEHGHVEALFDGFDGENRISAHAAFFEVSREFTDTFDRFGFARFDLEIFGVTVFRFSNVRVPLNDHGEQAGVLAAEATHAPRFRTYVFRWLICGHFDLDVACRKHVVGQKEFVAVE